MPVGLYQHSNVPQILPKVPVFPWKAEVGITSALFIKYGKNQSASPGAALKLILNTFMQTDKHRTRL